MTELLLHNGLCVATGKVARTPDEMSEWMSAQRRRMGLRAYECPFCHYMHLTHHGGAIKTSTRRDRKHRKHL